MSADRLSSEELRGLIAMATKGPWRWWTSCSFLRLSSDATGKDGDVAYATAYRDGHPGIECKEEDRALIAMAPDLAAEVLESRDALARKDEEIAKLREPRWFSLQVDLKRRDEPPLKPQFTRVPWSVAEKAYAVYSARYGRDQSLERMAQRGGFGNSEMDMFHPTWREEVDEIELLRAEAKTLRARVAELEKP